MLKLARWSTAHRWYVLLVWGAKDRILPLAQALDQLTADKAGAAGHENLHADISHGSDALESSSLFIFS